MNFWSEYVVSLINSLSQASGVSVSEEVKLRFDEIKKKKAFRYVILFIKDEKAIAVETTGKKHSFALK